MVVNAERLKPKLMRYNEAHGPVFKIHQDPRFTKIGKFLSHTGLDELPQLFNVLRGDMALIGPRPLPPEEAIKLKKWQQKRHTIKPGIVSPWVFEGYHSSSFDDWMESDIQYSKNKNLFTDLILTVRAISMFIKLIGKELFA